MRIAKIATLITAALVSFNVLPTSARADDPEQPHVEANETLTCPYSYPNKIDDYSGYAVTTGSDSVNAGGAAVTCRFKLTDSFLSMKEACEGNSSPMEYWAVGESIEYDLLHVQYKDGNYVVTCGQEYICCENNGDPLITPGPSTSPQSSPGGSSGSSGYPSPSPW
jgi:hypothetical protein